MRNWNFTRVSGLSLQITNCQPTYEELKRGYGLAGAANNQELPAYLWGIETSLSWRLCLYLHGIASLPMRNWNSSSFACFSNSAIFYCQPTYEELKQLIAIYLMCFLWIASLPMRNWNSLSRYILCAFYELPAYLWGIETYPIIAIKHGDIFLLPAYLWGIETLNGVFPGPGDVLYCQPTYEELKLVQTNNPWVAILHCQPTYEELKLCLVSQPQPGGLLLPAYLWGIETLERIKSLPKYTLIASLPMRNWNL